MKLNYKIYGEGAPIIILHGLFGMLDNWQTFAKKLTDDYKVILVDLRNHGRSPRSDEFNYGVLSQDIMELCEELDIDSTAMIGHSMGGKAAIQFAHDHPAMINKLVVVDVGIKAYLPGHDEIFEAIMGLDVKSLEQRSQADDYLAERIVDIDVRQFLLKNLSRSAEGGYKWKANFESLYNNYNNILDSPALLHPIDCETLFVRGLKSQYILEEDIASLEDQFTHMEVVAIDAGHWIHAERPVELLEVVTGFLSR